MHIQITIWLPKKHRANRLYTYAWRFYQQCNAKMTPIYADVCFTYKEKVRFEAPIRKPGTTEIIGTFIEEQDGCQRFNSGALLGADPCKKRCVHVMSYVCARDPGNQQSHMHCYLKIHNYNRWLFFKYMWCIYWQTLNTTRRFLLLGIQSCSWWFVRSL